MKSLSQPKWIFITNTLPILLLFFLFRREYMIIKSLLTESHIDLIYNYAIALGVLTTITTIYGLYLAVKRKPIPKSYGFISLFIYTSYLYLYVYHYDDMIPFNIPNWMVSENLSIYPYTFLMPTLAYALLLLVHQFSPQQNQGRHAAKSFAIAIAIPIGAFLLSQIGIPLVRGIIDSMEHLIFIVVILFTQLFLFFLIRGFYLLSIHKSSVWKRVDLYWKIPFLILLPLVGLLVNQGYIGSIGSNSSGIFGNFGSFWFYALTILNGILLCLPKKEQFGYRLALFIGKCITITFIFYFFIVFLPFFPLSVIAIVALGLGFLMLTPLAIFVYQINDMAKDWSFLQNHLSRKYLSMIMITSMLVLPIRITTSYLHDKTVLHEALDYIYTPDFNKNYDIDVNSLSYTLNTIKHHKNDSRGSLIGAQLPYLSTYFKWLVLDNLTLSDSKINTLSQVFFNDFLIENNTTTDNIQNANTKITNIASRSSFDESQQVWKSWVDLEITNNSDSRWMAEYATTLTLPEGCWISDYYLYVGDRKEMGILAEKKTAKWVFSEIRNENRDPGILYYLNDTNVAFRIFPFNEYEVRKSGFEIIHKEPIHFTIDNHILHLGNENHNESQLIENNEFAFIPKAHKKRLQQTTRTPYFHFILDTSEDDIAYKSDYIARIDALLKQYPKLANNAKISFTNTYINTISLNESWKSAYEKQHFMGGFYLDRGLKTLLNTAFEDKTKTYPIPVVITNSILSSITDKDFTYLTQSIPENDCYFVCNEDQKLVPYIYGTTREHPPLLTDPFTEHIPVLEYKNKQGQFHYLPNNDQASFIIKSAIVSLPNTSSNNKQWNDGLHQQANWYAQKRFPYTTNTQWLPLLKQSFTSKIMNPVSSYIVVENEAQKAILKRKQDQVINGHPMLDLSEDANRMSEPTFIITAILLTLLLFYLERKKKKQQLRS